MTPSEHKPMGRPRLKNGEHRKMISVRMHPKDLRWMQNNKLGMTELISIGLETYKLVKMRPEVFLNRDKMLTMTEQQKTIERQEKIIKYYRKVVIDGNNGNTGSIENEPANAENLEKVYILEKGFLGASQEAAVDQTVTILETLSNLPAVRGLKAQHSNHYAWDTDLEKLKECIQQSVFEDDFEFIVK